MISVSFFLIFCVIFILKYINNVIKNFEKLYMKCWVLFLFKIGRWFRMISSDISCLKVWFLVLEYVLGWSFEVLICRSVMIRYILYSVLWWFNDSRIFYFRWFFVIVFLWFVDDLNIELSVYRFCLIWVNVFKLFDFCVFCIFIYCLNYILLF